MSQNNQEQGSQAHVSTLHDALKQLKDDPSSLVELSEEELINLVGGSYAKILAFQRPLREDQVIIL
ncbi:MAG: hypothetical protein AAGE59_16275 [Cyanobacteria bacterium P01_F01_bin.86]